MMSDHRRNRTLLLYRERAGRYLSGLRKGLAAAFLVVIYIVHASAILLFLRAGRSRMRCLTSNASRYSRIALRLLDIRIRTVREYDRRNHDHGGGLIVANHVSWVDILILSSLLPSVFVTSMELKRTPVLGALARLSGCLFVERRSPSDIRREIESITAVLRDGIRVVLFPEGTTSNGDAVHGFKASLFDTAIRAGVDVRPVCLRYRRVNSMPIDERNRDRIYYYGGTRFLRHLPRVLALRSIEVNVGMLGPLRTRDYPSRKELAARAHAVIADAYRIVSARRNIMP